MSAEDKKYLKELLESELFALRIYGALLKIERDKSLREILLKLIDMEKKHVGFWQEITGVSEPKLSFFSKVRLNLFLGARYLFGSLITSLILEMIEIFGIKKYFWVWKKYKETDLAAKMKEILREEFLTEEQLINGNIPRKISIRKIRDSILGFNDGFVEILGALGGFFVIFENYFLVGIAGLVVGVAGSISMGASAFLSTRSAREMKETEREKQRILQKIEDPAPEGRGSPNTIGRQKPEGIEKDEVEKPLTSGLYVGFSYIFGALLPIIPFFLGAKSLIFPIVISILAIFVISYLTAFFTGESFIKRAGLNFVIITGAVLITFSLGYLVKQFLGVQI